MKKIFLLIMLSVVLSACDDDSSPVDNSVSFKQITNMWFEQGQDAEPPSPNNLDINYDAEDDEGAFDNLLATQQSGEVDIQ